MNRRKYVKQLQPSVIKRLRDIHRTSPSYRKRDRAMAIILSDRKTTLDELSSLFDVSTETVSIWVDRFEKLGIKGLEDAAKSGRPKIIDSNDLKKNSLNI